MVIKVVSPAARERKIRERLEGGQAERSVELGLCPEDGPESGSVATALQLDGLPARLVAGPGGGGIWDGVPASKTA